MKILGSSLSGTRVEMLIKISIIVGISIIFLEIFSYISMVANSEKCQFGTNQMFKNLDMKTKQELCEDLKSIKYTNDIIRLHEPNQHYNMLNINSHGFRGEEFNIEKQDNEYRIFVVGSSMILGLGATSDNTTIPFLLKEKFRDNGFIDVTIINGGIIAANSASEVYMIDNILPKYKPDMIIVYEGYNDSWDIPIYDINPIEKDREDKRDFIEKFVKENFDYLNFPKLVYQKTHDYFEISSVTGKMIKDNAKLWKERWESTCKSHKIPIVLLMQPVAGMGEKELTEDEEHLLKDEKYHIITQSYTEILKQSSDLECEYTYNLTNVFDSYNERIYVTRAHLTDNGNKILADEIFNLIHTYVEK